MSENENIYIINLDSGIDKSSPKISQFTHNSDCIKFITSKNLSDFSVILISSIENSVSITSEGETLIKTFNGENNETEILWYPSSEITARSGCVIYQIAAHNAQNTDEVWYSCEGRLIVSDSIDTTDYSAEVLGGHPNLLTQILTTVKSLDIDTEALKNNKVDKAEGMGLSQNSFTDIHKENLENVTAEVSKIIESAPQDLNTLKKLADAVDNNPYFSQYVLGDINSIRSSASGAENSINSHISDFNNPHNIQPGDIGLGHVDNTSDEDKPLSSDAREALDLKVDKVPGMGLSSNDFTELDKIRIEEAYHLMGDLSFLDTQNTDSLVDAINEVYGLASVHIKEGISGTLKVNTEYYLGVTHDLALTFPSNASPGDVVYINFLSPEQPTVLTIDMTNVFFTEIIPEADTGYEIFGKYTPDGWVINYSDFELVFLDYSEPDIMM